MFIYLKLDYKYIIFTYFIRILRFFPVFFFLFSKHQARKQYYNNFYRICIKCESIQVVMYEITFVLALWGGREFPLKVLEEKFTAWVYNNIAKASGNLEYVIRGLLGCTVV